FFQAEDGIRDFHVTGVQTCALPICPPRLVHALIPLLSLILLIGGALALFGLDALDGPIQAALVVCCMVAALVALQLGHPWTAVQIGRASCRERGYVAVVAGSCTRER